MDKPPCVELGRAMNWCARALHRQQQQGSIELPAEWWNGWKITKDRLIGPGGMTFNTRTLAALWRLARLGERKRLRASCSGASPAPAYSQSAFTFGSDS